MRSPIIEREMRSESHFSYRVGGSPGIKQTISAKIFRVTRGHRKNENYIAPRRQYLPVHMSCDFGELVLSTPS
jgi:hypothetical protein